MLYDTEDGLVIKWDDKFCTIIAFRGEYVGHVAVLREHVPYLLKGLAEIPKPQSFGGLAMSKLIEQVREAGALEALSKAIHSRMWSAKMACEEAVKDNHKHFNREVKKVRQQLDEAAELYKALQSREDSGQ